MTGSPSFSPLPPHSLHLHPAPPPHPPSPSASPPPAGVLPAGAAASLPAGLPGGRRSLAQAADVVSGVSNFLGLNRTTTPEKPSPSPEPKAPAKAPPPKKVKGRGHAAPRRCPRRAAA